MYHIDRNNNLKLNILGEIQFKKGIPNYSLNALINILKQLPNTGKLINDLTHFVLPENFPISNVFKSWGTEKIEEGLKPIIRKHRIELVYEYIRRMNFNEQISRYEGFYLTKNPNEWMEVLKIRDNSVIYNFEILDSAVLEEHDARWTELSMRSSEFEEICVHATNYWNRTQSNNFREEILALGTLVVLNKEFLLNR